MTKLIKVKYDDLTEVAQSAPQAVEFEQIASGSVELPVSTNKSIFLDSLDQEFKNIDSLGVVSTFGGSAGGLQPVFIDHTGIPAELIRDRIYEADFSGATAGSTLTVTFPEGTGAETFIIGFRITGLSENSSVTFQTTNSQNIFFPDATTDTSLTGVNTPTYLEFAWDQSRYVYGDVYAPIYFDLNEATSSVAGFVKKNKWQRRSLVTSLSAPDSDIAELRFINLVVGKTYKVSFQAYLRITTALANSSVQLLAKHNSINLANVYLQVDDNDEIVAGNSAIFTATTTTLEFEFTETGTGSLTASGFTWSQIEELNNYESETTDFT